MSEPKSFACHVTSANLKGYADRIKKRDDEKRAESFIAGKPLKVSLRIAEDKDTGLTMFIFEYFDAENSSFNMEVELANRYANDGSFSPCKVLAFDQKIDGDIGELKRQSREMEINNPTKWP